MICAVNIPTLCSYYDLLPHSQWKEEVHLMVGLVSSICKYLCFLRNIANQIIVLVMEWKQERKHNFSFLPFSGYCESKWNNQKRYKLFVSLLYQRQKNTSKRGLLPSAYLLSSFENGTWSPTYIENFVTYL